MKKIPDFTQEQMDQMQSLAIAAGITDCSYNTTANGEYFSFKGEAVIHYEGKDYKCVGHRASGDAYYGYDGYIDYEEVQSIIKQEES